MTFPPLSRTGIRRRNDGPLGRAAKRNGPLCIAILMFVISLAKLTTPNAYLLVVHYDEFCEAAIQSELNRSVRSSKLRSKTLTRAGAEMTYEVRISERTEVVTRMLDIEGVHDATLVACQSEVGA